MQEGLSREDIASKLGVSAMSIWRYQKGITKPQSRWVLRGFEALRKGLEKT